MHVSVHAGMRGWVEAGVGEVSVHWLVWLSTGWLVRHTCALSRLCQKRYCGLASRWRRRSGHLIKWGVLIWNEVKISTYCGVCPQNNDASRNLLCIRSAGDLPRSFFCSRASSSGVRNSAPRSGSNTDCLEYNGLLNSVPSSWPSAWNLDKIHN